MSCIYITISPSVQSNLEPRHIFAILLWYIFQPRNMLPNRVRSHEEAKKHQSTTTLSLFWLLISTLDTNYIDLWYKILTLLPIILTHGTKYWPLLPIILTNGPKNWNLRRWESRSLLQAKILFLFGRAKFLCNFRRLFEVLGVLGKEYNSIPTDDVNRTIIGNVAIHVVHLVTYVGSAATSGGQCKWHFMLAKFGTSILVLVLEPVQEWCSV